MRQVIRQLGLALVATLAASGVRPVAAQSTRLVPVGTGWARSSVNTAMFRTSSVVSRDGVQYTAYYDSAAHVVLARRAVGADRWEVVGREWHIRYDHGAGRSDMKTAAIGKALGVPGTSRNLRTVDQLIELASG